jgi:hypothetical protein
MATTQKSYVDNSSSVKAARKKLDAAKAALANANKAKAGLPSGSGKELASQIDTRIAQATKDLDKSLADVTEVETKAKNYFVKNEETITAKSKAKEKATAESNVAAVQAQIARMKEAGLDTSAIEAQLSRTKNKPVATETGGTAGGGSGSTAASVEQINKQLDALNKKPRDFIFAMSPEERIGLANTLTAAGYQTPDLNGAFNDGLVANYKLAISNAKAWNTANKELEGYAPVDLTGFLTYRTGLTKAAGGAGTGAGTPNQWGAIYNPTQAKAAINNAVTSLLGREATAKEVASITKKLTAAQKANPYKQVNGMTVGGLDASQFVEDLVKALPEYASKTQAKQDIVAQGIEATAKANGLKLRPEEIKSYADRVKNGEDIKTIESLIRSTASLGQPDAIKKLIQEGTDLETIYSPYKRIMANSLGINPNTITLDDPTLRMAIGPDKEMSLYDYQKAIRQDNRWKYSQEANDEVTNMVNQVKRDFGFMG